MKGRREGRSLQNPDTGLLELIAARDREINITNSLGRAWYDAVEAAQNDNGAFPEDVFACPGIKRMYIMRREAIDKADALRDKIVDTPAHTIEGAISKLAAAGDGERHHPLLMLSARLDLERLANLSPDDGTALHAEIAAGRKYEAERKRVNLVMFEDEKPEEDERVMFICHRPPDKTREPLITDFLWRPEQENTNAS